MYVGELQNMRVAPLQFLLGGDGEWNKRRLRGIEKEDALRRFPFLQTLHYITLTLHYSALRTLAWNLLLSSNGHNKTITCLLLIAVRHQHLNIFIFSETANITAFHMEMRPNILETYVCHGSDNNLRTNPRTMGHRYLAFHLCDLLSLIKLWNF